MPEDAGLPIKEEVQMVYPLFEQLIKTKLLVMPRVHFDAQLDLVFERNSDTLAKVRTQELICFS